MYEVGRYMRIKLPYANYTILTKTLEITWHYYVNVESGTLIPYIFCVCNYVGILYILCYVVHNEQPQARYVDDRYHILNIQLSHKIQVGTYLDLLELKELNFLIYHLFRI